MTLVRLSELVACTPGITARELRDVLRLEGRSSITTADIERTLFSVRSMFTSESEPASVSGSTPASTSAAVAAVAARCWWGIGDPGSPSDHADRVGRRTVVRWSGSVRWCGLPAGTTVGLLWDGSSDGLDRHDVVVAVVNSARTADLRPRRPGGLLVADECHRYGSEHNCLALHQAFPRRLGLSATFARPDRAHETTLEPYLGGVCYRLGYEQALRENVMAPFDLLLAGVDFMPEERAAYTEACQQMAKAYGSLLSSGCLADDLGPAFSSVLSLLAREDGEVGGCARGYLRAMQDRREVLDAAVAKRAALTSLVPRGSSAPAGDGTSRTIVFTQSIAAAEHAASLLNGQGRSAAAVHSGLPSDRRVTLMEQFRSGEIAVLSAPQVLDEGVDVPDADLALVLGASRSRRQMVQRMGRVLRRKTDGRAARFVVVFVNDTIEDPRRGAHETFLDEVTAVARHVEVRDLSAQADEEDKVVRTRLMHGV